MKRNLSTLLPVVVVLVAALIPWNQARAQAPSPDAPLAEQLKAFYKVTKFGAAAKGFTVLSPGTVLVIRKAGILGVPPANVAFGNSIYRDGELHQPTSGNRMIIGNVTRLLPVGGKSLRADGGCELEIRQGHPDHRPVRFLQRSEPAILLQIHGLIRICEGSLATADPAQIENTIGRSFRLKIVQMADSSLRIHRWSSKDSSNNRPNNKRHRHSLRQFSSARHRTKCKPCSASRTKSSTSVPS